MVEIVNKVDVIATFFVYFGYLTSFLNFALTVLGILACIKYLRKR